MRIAVFGDSILWGQGLLEDHKIARGVQKKLEVAGNEPVDLVSFAHSGADVWQDGETSVDLLNPLPSPLVPLGGVPAKAERDLERPSPAPDERKRLGEIPDETPYSLRQVDRASEELAGKDVDLILMDAGINDVNVPHIVLPYMSRHALADRTLSIGDRAQALLQHVHASFPSARIVVTGYYRIVTEFSRPERLLRFSAKFVRCAPEPWRRRFNVTAHEPLLNLAESLLESHDAAFSVPGPVQNALLGPLKARMVELSAVFARNVERALQEQVRLFNEQTHGNAALATPDIPPEHAAFTDEPWIWGLDANLLPQDEVAEARCALAHELTKDPFERFVWERASLGHPNVRGVAAYVDAIVDAIGD
jgi:hypothetical protein